MRDMAESMNKMFGKIGTGMCRLSMNGEIAVKTSTGYKAYNLKKNRLINCSSFVFDIGEEFFFVIPTNKVSKGDIILVNGHPKSRGNKKHGSCGHGIWEARVRHNNFLNYPFRIMHNLSDDTLYEYLLNIRENYFKPRLKEYDIDINDFKDYRSWIDSDLMIAHYISDFRTMCDAVNICAFIDDYETLIFEGGQGLALCETNYDAWPYVTASKTGASQLLSYFQNLKNVDIEICYVTRPYFTRHGAGPFPTECDRKLVSHYIKDDTNVYNEYQDDIRYGAFDEYEFFDRVYKDIRKLDGITKDISIMITQCDVFNKTLGGRDHIHSIKHWIWRNHPEYKIYMANSKYAHDVEVAK